MCVCVRGKVASEMEKKKYVDKSWWYNCSCGIVKVEYTSWYVEIEIWKVHVYAQKIWTESCG